jgi:hypothetical protein
MTRPRFALLAALFLLLVPLCSADVKESSTGISFAESIKLPGASCAAKLAGLGPRVKKIGPAAVKVRARSERSDPLRGAVCANLSAMPAPL